MFKRRKKTDQPPAFVPLTEEQASMHHPECDRHKSDRCTCAAGSNAGRALQNAPQQVIVATEGRTIAELVVAAGDNVPALVSAMTVMAGRFGQFVDNIHSLNKTLGEFKREVVGPFQQELKYLRYTTGERLNHASTNLEVYVRKLDQVMWGALRATGMSDEQIAHYREVNGMQPEAPTGPELEAHLREFEALKESNRQLVAQNQRLLAQLDTRHMLLQGEDGWVWHQGCGCEQCKAQYERVLAAQQVSHGA